MTFENKHRYYLIEGRRYEWRWNGLLCGLYEIEEPAAEEDDDWHPRCGRPVVPVDTLPTRNRTQTRPEPPV